MCLENNFTLLEREWKLKMFCTSKVSSYLRIYMTSLNTCRCHSIAVLYVIWQVYLIAKNGLISSVYEIKNTFLHTPQYSSPFAIWGANASSFPTSSLIFSNATSSCATSITSKGSFCASSTARIRCWRFLIWVESN